MTRHSIEDDWWSFYSWCDAVKCPVLHPEIGCMGDEENYDTGSCVHIEAGLFF